MTRKHHGISPDQIPAFELHTENDSQILTTWQDDKPTVNNDHSVYGPDGSYVVISERAHHLHDSLDSLGRRNQRLGFIDAAETRGSSKEIWGRYGRGTLRVVEGAQRREDELLQKAKLDFWQATGISSMRAAGIVTKDEADAMGRSMWRQFSSKYGVPGGEPTKLRSREKRTFQKQIKRAKAA